ncbi:hypothetical protein P3T37_003042 [Kitasatospora sp. MAA4]|uniref:hypothetical protein n=1 Tax=Kitasatospora sp. MAA4 TaxID=3035093 RepID=UPI002476376D|nr:hypothetical protein [Kitasatospora sp. MAA4]MDH6133646.1 hypothetical protein [Kitasatospora sp. MAA4]
MTTTRQRRGARRNDTPYPRRPLLTALWIPAAAVLLPLGGALVAGGTWMLLPALALVLTGAVGLIVALSGLCQSGLLRGVALALIFAPLIAVPLLSMKAAQATVLTLRGTTHPGTVTGVRVIHGRTTSYTCAVRYDGAPARTRSVDCGAGDAAGEQVSVTEDPSGLVEPEFSGAVAAAGATRGLDLFFDAVLLAAGAAAAVLGMLTQYLRRPRDGGLTVPGSAAASGYGRRGHRG